MGYVGCVSLFAAFLVVLFMKWGVIEYGQVHGNKFVSALCNCNFCLSWWASCIIAGLWFIVSWDNLFLVVPFFSTPLTRKLI